MKVVVLIALLALSSAVSSLGQALTFDSNVPDPIRLQMLADLDFMKSLQGSGASPLHQQIYGQLNGAAYDHFFQSRVTSVGLSNCNLPIAVACVFPFPNSSKMWLTENFVKFDHPQIARMMVVYHEARHTERANGFWHHARCPDPFIGPDGKDITSIMTGAKLGGQPGCDVTPMGSYGSSTIMLKNISKFCTNCTAKVKFDAGLYADGHLNRIINDAARQAMIKDIFKPF